MTMRAPAVVAIGVRQRVVAFEAPAREKRALRTMERAVQKELVALDAQKAETSTPRKCMRDLLRLLRHGRLKSLLH